MSTKKPAKSTEHIIDLSRELLNHFDALPREKQEKFWWLLQRIRDRDRHPLFKKKTCRLFFTEGPYPPHEQLEMLLRLSYEEIIDMKLLVETQLGHHVYVEVEVESSCEARFSEKGGELYWNRTGKILEVQLLVHRDKFDRLYGRLERLVPAKAGQGGGKGKETSAEKSVETTLFYNSSTGKFSFNGIESKVVSQHARTRVRSISKKLMRWWEKGKQCPQEEVVKDTTKKTPQGVYNDISTIRKTLEPIGVNMPQATGGGYPPPTEPQTFSIKN